MKSRQKCDLYDVKKSCLECWPLNQDGDPTRPSFECGKVISGTNVLTKFQDDLANKWSLGVNMVNIDDGQKAIAKALYYNCVLMRAKKTSKSHVHMFSFKLFISFKIDFTLSYFWFRSCNQKPSSQRTSNTELFWPNELQIAKRNHIKQRN